MEPFGRREALVFDDGSPAAVDAMNRALVLASALVVASVAGSTNQRALLDAATQAATPVDLVDLEPRTGIRHALDLCGERGIGLAVVPHPGAHPGELLRKCVQVAARTPDSALPALAVHLVVPGAPRRGPVLEMSRADVEAGAAAHLAIQLAVASKSALAFVALAESGDVEGSVRARAALAEAADLVGDSPLEVRSLTMTAWDPASFARVARGAGTVVVGFGGFEVHGHKLLAPDELPDRVLETPDGRIVHELARDAATDLVVVIDGVSLRS